MIGKESKFKALDSLKGFLEDRMAGKLKKDEEPKGVPDVGGEADESDEPKAPGDDGGVEVVEMEVEDGKDEKEGDISKLTPEEQDELKRLYNKMCG